MINDVFLRKAKVRVLFRREFDTMNQAERERVKKKYLTFSMLIFAI